MGAPWLRLFVGIDRTSKFAYAELHQDLTKPAVEAAMAEYAAAGRDVFLATYGFADSKRYWLLQNGNRYPSKAIAGVAHKYIAGASGPLTPAKFSGG